MPNVPQINVGGTSYKLKDTELRENIVLAQNAQPTNENNRIWLQENSEERQVPTWEEFNAVKSAIETQGLLSLNVNKFAHVSYTNGKYRYYNSGEIRTSPNYSYSDYVVINPGAYCTIENAQNTHTTFYDVNHIFINGTLSSSFVIPENAIYMVVSIAITDQSSLVVKWTDACIKTKPIIITDDTVLSDFNNAQWNTIYTFNMFLESYWNNIANAPTNENGTLITIDTNYTHYAAKHIYVTVSGGIFTRFYIPSADAFSNWTSGLTGAMPKFINSVDSFSDFNNAKWNKWYILNFNDRDWDNVSNKPIAENGTLITLDSNDAHYAARHIYITNTGITFVRFYAPPINSFTEWQSSQTNATKKLGVLYDKTLTNTNASDFAGSFSVVSGGYSITNSAILGKFYSIENRTCLYLCEVYSDSVVAFITAPYTNVDATDASIVINVSNKTVKLNSFDTETCSFLTGNHVLSVELSKHYQKLGVRITDMMTGDTFEREYINNGTGGAGEGATGTANNVPMQYDYYGCKKISGSAVLLMKMTVKCDIADVVCYGDSITEQEAYWPTSIFDKTWTQMLISESSQRVATSGRSGSNINQLTERIKNELPYIPAKFCVITIGTNSGNTEEKLTALVNYVKSLGVVPILNHIPCFNNNGDTTGFRTINSMIDTVRTNTGIKGCNFDIATSLAYDGQSVNPDMMWLETYSGGVVYRHHPNVKGCAAMIAQLKADVPEIF